MKLRLPHQFQAALLAAIASVSLTTLSSATAYAEETNGSTMHVYILTGQSNSLGAVKGEPLPSGIQAAYQSGALLFNGNMHKDRPAGATTNRYVQNPEWQIVAPQEPSDSSYSNTPCMGPEYGFAYMMEKKGWAGLLGENDALAVVKSSLDGGGNSYWLQTNNAYKTVLDSVQLSITQAVDMGYSNISLDGLMYLQGESNNGTEASQAATRFTDFLTYLNSDLNAWLETEGLKDKVTLTFTSNAVTGEPATWTASNIEPATSASNVTAARMTELATSNGKINADGNGYGFVYTQDLAKITRGDTMNVHYNGVSQLTIGARYAYAFAVQNGVDVGAVRGQDDSKNLDDAAAWWMEELPATDAVAVWDLSSVSHSIAVPECNNIANELTVGGIRIEDVYQPHATALGQGTVAITGNTLKVGASGIELQGGNLKVTTSHVDTTAAQSWKVAAGKTLQIGAENALVEFGGDHAISIGAQAAGQAAGMVKLNAATDGGHSFTIDDGAGLLVNAGDGLWSGTNISIGKSGSFGTVSDGDVTINSLSLDAGAVFDLGGGTNVGLHTGSLSLGGDATFRMNVDSVTAHDCLFLTSVTAASPSTVTFELTAGAGVRSGVGYVLAEGWDSSKLAAVSASDKAALTVDDGNRLIATFNGIADYTKPWVEPTGEPLTINSTTATGGIYDAAKVHGHASEDSSSFTEGNTASGAVYFFASNTDGNNGQVYAELKDAAATWVVAAGHNGGSGYRNNMNGSYHVKVTGTQAVTYSGVYAVTNGTIQGDAYIELCNDAATYNGNNYGDPVNGIYNGTVEGSVTLLVRSGNVKGDITGGHFTASAGQHIGRGVFVQVDGGSVSGQVRGGGKNANGTINGGTHVLVNGGTFAHNVMGGGTNGTINGGTEVIIRGGSIQGDVMGGGEGGTITGGSSVTITGGTIQGNVMGGGSGGTVNGGTSVTVEGNLASILGDISADTVTLQDISPNASGQQTMDKYSGNIRAATVVLNKYNVDRLLANVETQSLILRGGTTTTVGNLTLTACEISVEEGSELTLDGVNTYGTTTTYNGHVAIADGTTFTLHTATMVGEVSGYSDGENGFAKGTMIVLQKAEGDLVPDTALYSTSGSLLTAENTATFTGGGILTGAAFSYDATSGMLTAEAQGTGGPYFVNEGTVLYSAGTHVYEADDIRLNGGTLQFQVALKNGTALSVMKVGSGIIVDNGVSMAVNSVDAASLAQYGVTLTGTLTASSREELLSKLTGADANISTTANITLNSGDATIAGGVLTIGDALSLNLNGAKGNTYNISSFKQVVLGAGSTINYQAKSATFNNVTLANGDATISITDMGATSDMLTLAGETNLNGHKLSLSAPGNSWKRYVTIAKLVGDADSTLYFEGGKTDDGSGSQITINSLQGFGGTLELKENKTGNPLTATVNTGTGSAVNMKALSLTGSGEAVTVNADVDLSIGTLTVSGNSTIEVKANTWSSQPVTIGKLLRSSNATSSTLVKLYSTAAGANAWHFVLGAEGEDYSGDLYNGTLWVTTSNASQGNGKYCTVDVYLAAQDVLSATTLKTDNWESRYNNTRVSVSLGTDAKVAGITSGNNAGYTGAGAYIRSGALTVAQPNGVADFVSSSADAYTLEITGGGTYTSNAYIMNKVNLHMNGTGSQTFGVANNLGNMSYFDGSITVSKGKLVLTPNSTLATHAVSVASGAELTIAPTGVVTASATMHNEGTLNLTGTVKLDTVHMADFDMVEGSAQPVYSGVTRDGTTYANSGYLTTSAQYYLVKGGAESTLTGTVTIDSNTGTTVEQADDKSIIVTFKTNPTGGMFYVNDSFTYGSDMDAASDISIAKGQTLTAANNSALASAKVLHGEGKYALASQATGLNSGLTLGADWTGSVVLSGPSGTTVQNINLRNSAVGTAGAVSTSLSTIELKGIQGWLKNSGANYNDANLIMTNPSEGGAALRLDNGTSGACTYFTGSISGSGDLEHIWNRSTVQFEMQGDLSQWTGNIIKSAGGDTVFTFNNNPGGVIAVGAKGNSGNLSINVTNNAPVTLTGNFVKGSGTLTVTVKDTTQATFTGTITNANLSVNTGASATMATDATITGITNSGTLAVTGGHTVKLINSADANLGNVLLSDGDSATPSTIGVRGDGAARTYTIGNLAVSGQGHVSVVSSNTGGQGYHAQVNITNLTNADDSPATIYLGNSAHANTSIYNINGGSFTGEIVLRGESDNGTRRTGYQFNDANVAANSVITFDKAALGGSNKLGLGLGADITVQGIRHAADVNEDTIIYSGAYTFGQNSDFVSYGTDVHTITIAGAGEYSTSATVKSHVNLTMNGEGTQTFSGDMSAFDGAITVNKGTLAITGDNGISTAYITSDTTAGTLEVTKTLTLTQAGLGQMSDFTGTLKVGGLHVDGGYHQINGIARLGGSIQIGDGILTVGSGTYELSELQLDGPGEVIPTEENGYKGYSGTVQFATMTGEGYLMLQDNLTFTHNGYTSHTLDAATGVVTFDDHDYTTYYVNGDATYSDEAMGKAQYLQIAQGKVLTAGAAAPATAKTLVGSGTYALASGAKKLGDKISLDADNWTGTVAISNASFANDMKGILESLGNENSWVALKGTSGWAATCTINANLLLEKGDNDWAFAQNNGNNNNTLTFAGKIAGDGKLGRSSETGSTYTYEFTNDISKWDGTFESRSFDDKYTMFRVKDAATEVNASLTKATGVFKVDVQNQATFNGAVSGVDELTVAANQSAKFTSALEVSGAINVGTGATLTLAGETSIAKAITNNGTVVFNHDITASGLVKVGEDDTYSIGADGARSTNNNYFNGTRTESTIRVVSGGTVTTGDHTVTQGGVAYALKTDGTATGVTADGVDYSMFLQYEKDSVVQSSSITSTAAEHGAIMVNVSVDSAKLIVDSGVFSVGCADAEIVIDNGGEVYGVTVIAGDNTYTGTLNSLTGFTFFAKGSDSTLKLQNAQSTTTPYIANAGAVDFYGSQVSGSNVKIDAAVSESGSLDTELYALDNARYTVEADMMVKRQSGNVTVNNHLKVNTVSTEMNTTGSLTLANGAATRDLRFVTAVNGDIEFRNMKAANSAGSDAQTKVGLQGMYIFANKTVSFYEATDPTVDASVAEVTIANGGVLQAQVGAKLEADLVMKAGSTMDVSQAQDSFGLELGCSLTIEPGALLSQADMTAISGLTMDNRWYFLDTSVEQLHITGIGDWDATQGQQLTFTDYSQFDLDASRVYTQLASQRYAMVYNWAPAGTNVGTYTLAIYLIPEPTTSTLSLLALAALAARRRRK